MEEREQKEKKDNDSENTGHGIKSGDAKITQFKQKMIMEN